MEFADKLQKLRKDNNLTQEQLAEKLFVSRTAVSKWESNRGYPNIESLKAISKLFSISIDELLSGDELIDACEKEGDSRVSRTKAIVFSCIDLMLILLLFLPLFKEQGIDKINSVSLLSLSWEENHIKVIYMIIVILGLLYGLIYLVVIAVKRDVKEQYLNYGSIGVSVLLVGSFISCQEPYAAIYTFVLLMIKVVLLINKG